MTNALTNYIINNIGCLDTLETFKDNFRGGGNLEVRNFRENFTRLKQQSLLFVDKCSEACFPEHSSRIHDCGTRLIFFRPESSDKVHLIDANFCRDRLCPMCQARRARKFSWQVQEIVDHIGQDHHYYLLTLTVVNVPGYELKACIDRMQKRFGDMMNDKRYRNVVLGYVRSLEITYNKKAQTFHPHFHVLLELSDDYARRKQSDLEKEFLKLWQTYYGDDSIKIIDIRPCKELMQRGKVIRDVAGSCREVAKYSLSLQDDELNEMSPSDFRFLVEAIHGRLLISFCRSFRKARTELKQIDVDKMETADLCAENKNLVQSGEVIVLSWVRGKYLTYSEFEKEKEYYKKYLDYIETVRRRGTIQKQLTIA